jgi:RND family efflux transporter MFP subunit
MMSATSLRSAATIAGRAGAALCRWRLVGAGLVPAALLLLSAGCNPEPPPRPKKPAEVVVTTPVRGEVVDYQDFTGRLDGYRTVDIRARVSGYITEAPFKEGDHVQEGALLFQIDPRPYQATLNQAEAQVRLQEAQLKYQEALYQRNVRLLKQGQAVAMEDVELSQAQRDTTAAQLEAARAAVKNAALNLEWTKVTAPLSGRISRRFVDPGNLVISETTAANTALTTLVSDHQLYAYFDVDERTYLDLVKTFPASPGSPGLAKLNLPVLMSLANEGDQFGHVGHIDFIDNRVTATTGTIRMRGVFDNTDGLLKAGLFGRFRLPLGRPYATLLIDAEALQSDQGHTFVYVVTDKNEVAYRRLEVGQEVKGRRVAEEGPDKGKPTAVGLRVVKDGLKAGGRVIVQGMQRVRPGAAVEAKAQEPPEAPVSHLVRLLAGKVGEQSGAKRQESAGKRSPDTNKPVSGK